MGNDSLEHGRGNGRRFLVALAPLGAALVLAACGGQPAPGPGIPPDGGDAAGLGADAIDEGDGLGQGDGAQASDATSVGDGGDNSGSGAVQAPVVVGRMMDGTPRDVAIVGSQVLVAEGRNIAAFDGLTGAYLGSTPESPYADHPVALEYDPTTGGGLYVATEHTVMFRPTVGPPLLWTAGPEDVIVDLKLLPRVDRVVVLFARSLVLLDNTGSALVPCGSVAHPDAIPYFRRLNVGRGGGADLALVVGDVAGATSRSTRGLAIFDLQTGLTCSDPILESVWLPELPEETVVNAITVEDYAGSGVDVAFVAAGLGGQLLRLDLSDLMNPMVLERTVINQAVSISNLVVDAAADRLLVMGWSTLFTVDLPSRAVLGSAVIGGADGGVRDMALWERGAQRVLWHAAAKSSDYGIQGTDVSGDVPGQLYNHWWISSSDGAVAVPAWRSIYLPTFGGVGRYDITDLARPERVADGFAPAQSITEHIDLLYPDPEDRSRALLLTATGTGGFQGWPVSAANPNPSPPFRVETRPPTWVGQGVYQNDVTSYRANGTTYVLVDLGNLTTKHAALMAYDLSTETWVTVETAGTHPHANTVSITIAGDYAVVTWGAGFFVVSLRDLPDHLSITAEVAVDMNGDGTADGAAGLAADLSGTTLFAAGNRVDGVASYALDQATGAVTGPLSVLTDDRIGRSTSRARYNPVSERLYSATDDGRIHEIDVADPHDLRYLSQWDSGTGDEMQDARIYDFGDGPRVLAVINLEGFAILDPDDGGSRYPAGRLQSPLTKQIANRLRAVVAQSQARDPHVFSKGGDSISASANFMQCLATDESINLGGHAELAPVISHFRGTTFPDGGNAFNRNSLATLAGASSPWLVDGTWPNPLQQELEATGAGYAVLMMGTNDLNFGHHPTEHPTTLMWRLYAQSMLTAVDQLVDRGVVPILSTIPARGAVAKDEMVSTLNTLIRALAQSRMVPLMDLHQALEPLPNRGLDPAESPPVHPSVDPVSACDFTSEGLQYGYNTRNASTLAALNRALAVTVRGLPFLDSSSAQLRGTGAADDAVVVDSLPFADARPITGTEPGVLSDYGFCGGADQAGPELVYALHLASETRVRALAVSRDGADHCTATSEYFDCLAADDLSLHHFAGSLEAGACDATATTLVEKRLAPGTHYFVIDTPRSRNQSVWFVLVQCDASDPACE